MNEGNALKNYWAMLGNIAHSKGCYLLQKYIIASLFINFEHLTQRSEEEAAFSLELECKADHC